MKKYLFLFIAAISLTFAGCDHESDFTPPNYITFAENSAKIGVGFDSSTTYDVMVYTANEVSEDRTYNVNVLEPLHLQRPGMMCLKLLQFQVELMKECCPSQFLMKI